VVDTHRHSGWNISLERALLRAAAEETAPPDVQRRTLAALGLLLVATPTSVAATAATGSAARVGTLLTPWAVKLVVGVGLALTGIGGLVLARSIAPGVDRSKVVVMTVSSADLSGRGTHPPRARLGETSVHRVVTPEGSPHAEAAGAVLASLPKGGTTSGRRNPSIRAEVRLLDRAGLALSDGAPEQALSVLREYARRFPRGALRQEAEVLRIRALQAEGSDGPAK